MQQRHKIDLIAKKMIRQKRQELRNLESGIWQGNLREPQRRILHPPRSLT